MPEPLFVSLVTALVPLRVPPTPFASDDLQRLFTDVSRDVSYQQFQFLPGGAGAQMLNSPDDLLMVQPGLIQVRRRIDSTTDRARETTMALLRAAEKRLGLKEYVQCGVKVLAHVDPPSMEDAKAFVAERLMREGSAATQELGPSFFGSGVKFTSYSPTHLEVLNVEPLLANNGLLFVDYDVQRGAQFDGLEIVKGWIDDAFNFVRGPAMRILEV